MSGYLRTYYYFMPSKQACTVGDGIIDWIDILDLRHCFAAKFFLLNIRHSILTAFVHKMNSVFIAFVYIIF